MQCNYFSNNNYNHNNNNNVEEEDEEEKNPENNDSELIIEILSSYYNACNYLKAQKWKQSMELIDHIYKCISKINTKNIRKKCGDI